jgi:hypothetical protein
VGGEFEIEGLRVPLSIATLEDSLLVAFNSPQGIAVGSFGFDGRLQQLHVADSSGTDSGSVVTTQQGDILVAWNALSTDAPIRAHRFEINGDPGSTFVVDDNGLEYAVGTRAAPWTDGSFVVVWGVERSTGDAVLGRMFGPDDEPLGDRFLVSTVSNSIGGDVCVDDGETGDFIVVWHTGSGPRTRFRRFNAEAEPRTPDLCLGLHGTPSASCLSGGRFVAAGIITT